MQGKLRLIVVVVTAIAVMLTASLVLAQEAPEGPQVAACLPGAGYTSGCDVDQDGDIDIFDVQLTAGRWGASGAYTAGHTHWGETWTGAGVVDGLRLVHTDVSGYRYGVTGTSASTSGRGVYGYVSAASGETFGVQGQSASVAGRGVYGLSTAASGAASGVFGESASTSGRGVYGEATATSGSAYGVYGRSAGDSGRGVFGDAVATSGMNYGVYGRSVSDAGRGVYGDVTATSGNTVGVYGRSASDTGRGLYGLAVSGSGETFGVVGQAESTAGVGVHGYTAASTGATMGVWGLTLSDSGIGVLGSASSTTGVTHGVDGRSYSSQGTGVYGVNYATTGFAYGVYGRSFSTAGYAGYFSGKGNDAVVVENTGSGRGMYVATSDDTAIWAITTGGLAGVDGRSGSSTGRGVYGYATASSGVNYGVYARTSSASGYAGYFLGDLHTTGTLSKAGGSFKIDHPLDPANQYLSHSFVESPDMKNIYDGVALLDARGAATVTLPDWFGALNRDFRYQLTPVGAAMPNLHVAQKIQDNTFRIAGGEPGLEVSWQVTGIRQDAWANAHRIPVEEEKPADERGTYLHPAELGQPEELGLDYQRNAGLVD
jgi:hypothetical protein